MRETALEPNESKKGKAGSEWAMSVGKTESDTASRGVQWTLRVLLFVFCVCAQPREALCQERRVTGVIQNLRRTQWAQRQLMSCIKCTSANSKEVSSVDFHTAKFDTILCP